MAASNSNGVVTQSTPANWQAFGQIADSEYYMWSLLDSNQSIPPGGSVNGFGIASADPPSIVGFLAWNFTPPMIFPRGEARACSGSSIIENSFKGSTVGPKAPPSTDRIQLVNYLISLLHHSRRLGWISTNGAHQDLLAKLVATKRKIESNDIPNARDQLQQFLDQAVQRSCQTQNCNNRPLNTDAYAVLYYNGQNLMQRL